MKTLQQAIINGRGIETRGFTFYDGRSRYERLSHDDLAREALRRGRYLRSLGLEKGDRIALVLPDNKDFVLSFLGAISHGIVPVPLYPPMPSGRFERYLERTTAILNSCRPRRILIPELLSPLVDPLSGGTNGLEGIVYSESFYRRPLHADVPASEPELLTPTDPCFIQYTSGTTSRPKGVVLSHANVMSNALGLIEAVDPQATYDSALSWLPLYHDMGLMLVMAPIVFHYNAVFIPPLSFVTRPACWMQAVHDFRATVTASPNFGLALAAKYAKRVEQLDLSCLRAVVCGAEPIQIETARRFTNAFRPARMAPEVIVPAYGLAESTLCVTIHARGAPMRSVYVDRDEYHRARRVKRRLGPRGDHRFLEIVSCGRPLRGHEVAIMTSESTLASPGEIGEIVCRGPSVTSGYFECDDDASELFRNGWMTTGDLGFILDGDLFVSGRKKDLIIVAGRNYHPHCLEWSVAGLPSIRSGCVAAFSIPGPDGERVVVVAECKAQDDLANLASEVTTRVASDLGITAHQVVFVNKGALPKTTSGKLQRAKARSAYLAGTLDFVEGSYQSRTLSVQDRF